MNPISNISFCKDSNPAVTMHTVVVNGQWTIHTIICPRSGDLVHITTYNIQWVTTSWTYRMVCMHVILRSWTLVTELWPNVVERLILFVFSSQLTIILVNGSFSCIFSLLLPFSRTGCKEFSFCNIH